MKKQSYLTFLSLFLLPIVGCESTYYLRSEGIRPGMSLQYIIDSANNIQNCKLPYARLGETTDYIVYQMYFISGDIVRPYRCTFSNAPTPASQILQSIEYDQAQNMREADAIMKAAEIQREAIRNMFAPPGQRRR